MLCPWSRTPSSLAGGRLEIPPLSRPCLHSPGVYLPMKTKWGLICSSLPGDMAVGVGRLSKKGPTWIGPPPPKQCMCQIMSKRAANIMKKQLNIYSPIYLKPEYKARHAHKRLYTVLPKYSKIQVLPGITSCRLMKSNKQAIELNSLLINNMPKDGYEWN